MSNNFPILPLMNNSNLFSLDQFITHIFSIAYTILNNIEQIFSSTLISQKQNRFMNYQRIDYFFYSLIIHKSILFLRNQHLLLNHHHYFSLVLSPHLDFGCKSSYQFPLIHFVVFHLVISFRHHSQTQ